ncbi:MAG: transmembrane 220 family protein [Opitutaceae bacterium]
MRNRSLPWKIINGLFGALFLFAAALQFNDSDPLSWIAIYLAASAPCFLEWTRFARWPLPAVVGLFAIGWALVHASGGAWTVPLGNMFDEWDMKNEQVRETREVFGLLIVAGWMLVLAATGIVRARRASENPQPGTELR